MQDYTFWTRALTLFMEVRDNNKDESKNRELNYLIKSAQEKVLNQINSGSEEEKKYVRYAWITIGSSVGSVLTKHGFIAQKEEEFTKAIEATYELNQTRK